MLNSEVAFDRPLPLKGLLEQSDELIYQVKKSVAGMGLERI